MEAQQSTHDDGHGMIAAAIQLGNSLTQEDGVVDATLDTSDIPPPEQATVKTASGNVQEQPTSSPNDNTAGTSHIPADTLRRPVQDETVDKPTDLPSSKGVKFSPLADEDAGQSGSSHAQEIPGNAQDRGRPTHQRQSSRTRLMTKIRSLAPSVATTPTQTRNKHIADDSASPRPQHEVGSDADEEESGHEGVGSSTRHNFKGKKKRRFLPDRAESSPISPTRGINRSVSFANAAGVEEAEEQEHAFVLRRSSMTDLSAADRFGVSEDEGRARISRRAAWKRRMFSQNSVQHLEGRRESAQGAGEKPARPGNLKRLSQLGGGSYDASTSPWHLRSDPAQRKWRQLKAGLRLLGQKRKAENRVDYAKSAELVAELLAGSPAALMLASAFQRDDHERPKVPILLEQLRVAITDSQRREDSSNEYHVQFRIECEYFNGRMHMKWDVWRSLFDFLNLHSRLKFSSGPTRVKGKHEDVPARAKMPRFPKSAFPFLKGVRGLADDEEEDPPAVTAEEPQTTPSLPSVPPSPGPSRTPRPGRLHARRESSALNLSERRENYAERQRKKMETYLREMIRFQMFRAGSNRICKFLELSTISVRMSIDKTFKGKEGVLQLKSTTGMDPRRRNKVKNIFSPARGMWFLVRESYIFCVDSVDDSRVYDVFLVDADFSWQAKRPKLREQKGARDLAKAAQTSASHPSKQHVLRLTNSERKATLFARNERTLGQFEKSIETMAANTPWKQKKRFDSFAPVRQGVFAMWLVDARDYFWNVSRGIAMAKHVIYIHDWWLSPELYLRRPPAVSHKWRLDRLLQQKASEGVKIYVIVYRNVNTAIPIQSDHTKSHLLDLHPNIFVQRSPNQVRQKSFFWAHHEKVCVVDYNLAFCGGVDLCFGRYDAPDHLVTDDKPTGLEPGDFPRDTDHCQTWPGKDYSNPRVQDFYGLEQPYAEMYDRSKVPRMPWHDIGMQVVGQPARDLARHFVQRWNYVLRQRSPSRPTPFLIPPPDFTEAQLDQYGLRGTCEVQMLRSCTEWSIGTVGKTEHSILNAYIRLIDRSEHFVYIENQFFITSTMMDNNTKIINPIGDSLFERAVRAHKAGESWKAVIIIPLMPGFQSTVDSQDGTSVRLIMTSQYRSISRGKHSLFVRLKEQGIEPTDYIEFYSLRNWGKIGPTKALVTEQLYIHAKCMVVDDRYAIIGSANINERSMLGSRDSEIAAVVRDTDFIDSFMAGKPFKVARFAHTLRMRLMREHIGIDVDSEAIKKFQFADFSYGPGDDEFVDAPETKSEMQQGPGEATQAEPAAHAKRNLKSKVHKNVMRDPLAADFLELWRTISRRNTEVYRQVFRCMPDDTVRTWKEYEECVHYNDRFAQVQGLSKGGMRMPSPTAESSGGGAEKTASAGAADEASSYIEQQPREGHEPEVISRDVAEELLNDVVGHVVDWPYRW